ncbi:MAG: hypothetical protein IE927_15615 [Rhodobacterales bacterium]|nr:hypothetical protein [Rhodobacterales bacterium]
MTPQDIQALFTASDGSFRCARWGRPIVPVVFGVQDATLATVKGAIEAVVALAGCNTSTHRCDPHSMAETDPELGANLMIFFLRDWSDLAGVPGLDRLLPELPALLGRLQARGANQYRLFRFDAAGAIRACFVFLRMDDHLSALPAEVLALSQAVGAILLWSDRAFDSISPLAEAGGHILLRPEIGAVIRAAYDPVLPAVARDPAHALRLAARIGGRP